MRHGIRDALEALRTAIADHPCARPVFASLDGGGDAYQAATHIINCDQHHRSDSQAVLVDLIAALLDYPLDAVREAHPARAFHVLDDTSGRAYARAIAAIYTDPADSAPLQGPESPVITLDTDSWRRVEESLAQDLQEAGLPLHDCNDDLGRKQEGGVCLIFDWSWPGILVAWSGRRSLMDRYGSDGREAVLDVLNDALEQLLRRLGYVLEVDRSGVNPVRFVTGRTGALPSAT